MTEKSETVCTTLAQALVAIAREIKDPLKDAENPHFKNKYASLDATIDVIRELAAKHGISISQSPLFNKQDNVVELETCLLHESGEQSKYVHSIPLGKADPQGFGSALTYLRRYALQSLFCVTGETDDDANSAQPQTYIQSRHSERAVLTTANENPLSPPDSERKYSRAVTLDPPISDGDREKLARQINDLAAVIGEHKGQSARDVIADASSFPDSKTNQPRYFTDPMERRDDGSYIASLKWLGATLKNIRDYCKKHDIEVAE